MSQKELDVNFFRRETMAKIIKAVMSGENVLKKIENIPFEIVPRNAMPIRCCVYKERAIGHYRSMAALGFLLEDEKDERTPLSHYAEIAMNRKGPENKSFIISTCDIACHACVAARFFVTDLCQGCLAHPCLNSCNFGAISIVNGQSIIDSEKCRNCGMCKKACPYEAIVQVTVPCEKACPVNAIKKDEDGRAKIDFSKCIFCGRCMRACPFGAILERSQMVDVAHVLSEKKHATALFAPALAGQFKASVGSIVSALKKLGFTEVVEVAEGADVTSRNEATEFIERMEHGQKCMTTSCCPAYIQAVEKIIPELLPFVSDTRTPMHYAAELALERFPETHPVFIGPCVAKRVEGIRDDLVYAVLTFEELGAFFAANDIAPEKMEAVDMGNKASEQGRMYAVSGGVAEAVRYVAGDKIEIQPLLINGLSKDGLKKLRSYATGACPGNLIEIMACEGGCVGGSGVISAPLKTAKAVQSFAKGK